MKWNKMLLISMTLLILLLSISGVSASDLGQDSNQTLATDSSEIETAAVNDDINVVQEIESSNQNVLSSNSEDSTLKGTTEEIIVNDWNDLQYYCSLTDKDYTLKLKKNTNYYPDDVTDSNYQILVNNNVKIIGNKGAYIGDTSPDAANITYTAILVPDDNHKGIIMENVTFKWIGTRYQPDGVFLQMCGDVNNNAFINCYFTNISTNLGHSSILHIKTGNVDVINCTFINCTTDFGCLSVYNPKDDPTGTCTRAAMNVTDSYFEGNYARTEPGCINNCGILVVNNSTFYKNSAFWWAGAIHTHGGANTTIYDSDFIDNLAGWNGGALYTYSYLQIYNTRFIGNNCTTNNGGGAIGACKYLHAPYIRIEECLFENNENLCWGLDELSTSGTGRGGAISLMDEGGLEVYNSTFIKNSASIGTAICAINGGLSYGSPDVRIIGNSFINHTRVGDVLDVRVATGSVAEIRDNYYYNNSLVYEKLKLTADDPVNGVVTFHIDARLKNPNSFDADILSKSKYDVYVNGVYKTTVSSTTFNLNIDGTAKVYVMPSISNSKSNEVSAGIAKKYIYVSQSSGNDGNTGLTRSKAVKTLTKAIELANTTGNIVLIDGTFRDTNLTINYNLTISAEKNAVITITGNGFTITDGDVKFENVTFKNCNYGSSAKNRLISQTNSGFLILDGCVFEGNEYKIHIDAAGILDGENLKFTNNKDGSVIKANSISLKSSEFINNTATYSTAKGLVMYKTGTTKFEVENLTFINNTVSAGCIDVKKNKATISDCTFIGNSITSSNKGSAILMEDSCSLLVESSKFINNKDIGKYSSVIYISSGTLVIRDSILINNSYENTNGIVINGGETYLKKLNANNNWWGNTPDNLTKPALKTYGVSNQLPNGWDPAQYWLVLNVTSVKSKVELNEIVPVQFAFSQVDNEGNVTVYDGVNMPSFDLKLSPVNGTCSNKVTVENGMATTYFKLTKIASSSLTGSFNGISETINFTFKKSAPDINITANDINVGSSASIVVNVPSDATGTVNIKVGDITKTATISNSKATFSIPNLAAGTYTVEANYTGNNHYVSAGKTATFKVNKVASTTQISVGTVAVNNDVIVTITLPSDATGKVDVYVNNVKNQTIDAGSTFTIPKIKRGLYEIKAVYKGDSKYLSSQDTYTFEVARLTPTVSVSIPDIVYGNDVVVTVTVNSGATGSVNVTIDGKSATANIANSKATVRISGIDAGNNKKAYVSYSGCNDYKDASTTKTFNVAKAKLSSFAISSNNIKYGQDAKVQITLPSRIGGTLTISGIKSETKNVPSSGLVTLTYEDLAVGSYTVKATYSSTNYNTTSKSVSFTVSDWNQAESANEGINIERTGKVVYGTICNGEIKWSATVGKITGNLAIDSQKNLYITTETAIYSYTNAGKLRWVFTSDAAGANFAGIALSRDVVIAPKVNDTLYFIDQATGERYGHANLYQGSSSFSPVVDSEGNVYISGQGESNNPSLVIIPYKIWEEGGNPIVIDLGSNPTAAPTILNENLVVVPCEDSIKVVDISSRYLAFSKSGNIKAGYAVAGQGNVLYTFLGNYIYKFSESGSQLWRTKVTDGVGSQLFLDSEIGLYSVNSKGVLYRYDIEDGSESKFCNYNLKVTSGIMIDGDNRVYFGTADTFYAFDSDGNMLWKSKIGSKITGTPVMNKNGIICINTANKVYELKYLAKQSPNLAVSCSNIYVGSDETISISLNENATGTVKLVVNGVTYTLNTGTISKVIKNLPAGTHTAEVTYSGDMRYSQATKIVNFNVNKYPSKMNVTVKDIDYGKSATVSAVFLSDVTGTVKATVDGKTYTTTISNGKATISIPGLTAGNKNITVRYYGDDKYNARTIPTTFKVNKIAAKLTASVKAINYGKNATVTVSVPSDATGTVKVLVNGKTYSTTISNAKATFTVPGLNAGTYPVDITYNGNTNYLKSTLSKSLVVNKVTPSLKVTVSDINVGQTAVFKIVLPTTATGKVSAKAYSITNTSTLSKGKASVSINGIASGNRTYIVKYPGDANYLSANYTAKVYVSKVNPSLSATTSNIYVGDTAVFNVKLASDATGSINLLINNKTYTGKISKGAATINVKSLAAGNYTAKITYAGDSKYLSATLNKKITVSKISKYTISAAADGSIINVNVPADATGKVILTVGGKTYKGTISNGSVSFTTNLASGKYKYSLVYNGNKKYESKSLNKTITIKLEAVNISAPEVTCYYSGAFTATLQDSNGNAISKEEVCIKLNGNEYKLTTTTKGKVTTGILTLPVGSYDVEVSFAQTTKYASSSVASKFTVMNSVKSSNMNRGYNSGLDFKATFLTNKGKAISNSNVTITIDGKSETVDLQKGVLKLDKKLAVGSHKISGKNPVTGEKFSNTVKIVSRIQSNKDMNISYGDAPYYKVRIYGDDGNPVGANQNVTMNVANKDYTVKTDKDGYAQLKISLIPKTYTITTSYKGQSVKNTLVVKPVIVAKDVTKKKATSYKYTVTLKKYTGTLLKNQKVTLTIKGQTYSATTNDNGVATFTIKQTLKVGSYKMTINYIKSSLVKTLTIN